MTLTMEIPPATVATDDLEWGETLRVQTDWAQAAMRVHGLLSQTLSDEVLDELLWAAETGLTRTAFVAPPFLFG